MELDRRKGCFEIQKCLIAIEKMQQPLSDKNAHLKQHVQ